MAKSTEICFPLSHPGSPELRSKTAGPGKSAIGQAKLVMGKSFPTDFSVALPLDQGGYGEGVLAIPSFHPSNTALLRASWLVLLAI